MKAAFAVWNNRIAPVFDAARQMRIVEVERGRAVGEIEVVLQDDSVAGKARELSALGVDALICGAISRSMASMIAARGVQVIAFVAGDLQAVIEAWLYGKISDGLFAMPGCRGRRRLRGSSAIEKEEYIMKGRKQGAMGQGGGQGGGQGQCRQGRGGQGGGGQGGGQGRGASGQSSGRMGGPLATGTNAQCVCTQCGHQQPHQRAIPCTQQQCPKCGGAMVRQ